MEKLIVELQKKIGDFLMMVGIIKGYNWTYKHPWTIYYY